MNLAGKVKSKADLAVIYMEDGAFFTAASILRDLAELVTDRAILCALPGHLEYMAEQGKIPPEVQARIDYLANLEGKKDAAKAKADAA